jgi:glutamate formiminotransferase/formiminotetrahydrofolate cyclodeaminase
MDAFTSSENSLVEIVPNFSEGRRPDVIEAILEALRVPRVRMLTWQADPDHNRLDATLVGSVDAVRRSALAGAAKAAELIDLNAHRGSHPRMGATDVIPFLPIRGITMQECVDLARDVAREIGERLEIPVYCYEEAAFVPERRSLAEVRKGEYEGLRDDVAAGRRLPDFGPKAIGSAGAVAVGARKPLVAFNVYFGGDDETAVKAIARRVRESSGGLKNVRAIGFRIEDRPRVTVSMNLVDLDATPIYRALELVRLEASRYGLTVLDAEIVGMVPERALTESAQFYLQLEGFDPDDQILERVLASADGTPRSKEISAGIQGASVGEYLEALASSAPTPGGGTAAAVTGASGAALVVMAARLTKGKAGFGPVEPRMDEIMVTADQTRASFLDLAERDKLAFDSVMRAYALPKAGEEERMVRGTAVQAALVEASTVPLQTARLAVNLLDLALEVAETGNPNVLSDATAGGELLGAACRGALWNVEINARSIRDEATALSFRQESRRLASRAGELVDATTAAFASRIQG